ncbi:6-phosphogluconolactonase [Planctomycetaceae bacterium SH139]
MQPPFGTLQLYDDAPALAAATAIAFQELANQVIATDRPFRVALSGGSTPQRLYRLLATTALPWDQIEWYWGDERNVPHDHPDSNYRMVCEALLNTAPVPPANVFPVPIEVDNPTATARNYAETMQRQFQSTTFPRFDLVLLGIGDDAHTASLFPNTSALQVSDKVFVENWVPQHDTFRLTLTAPTINAASHVWFLITGENKQDALAKIWGAAQEPQQFPAQLVKPENGQLRWLTSREALPN